MRKYRGILFTVLSAVIFGITPILGKITFAGGSNGTNLTFWRALLSLPVLYAILKWKGIPIRVPTEQFWAILKVGVFGTSLTTLTLYLSYDYISVGMATTLHFVYPLLVTLGCVFFYKERMNRWKVLALLAGTAGIAFFLEPGSIRGGAMGIVLALFSGLCYAFYIIYLDKSGLKNLYFFKLSFYLCGVMALVTGIFGAAVGSLTLSLTPQAWFYTLLVSLLTSVGALSLFQLGVQLVGASTASILCTFEPITSVILGVLILGEKVNVLKIAGCICILVSVVLITRSPAGQPVEEPVG